jgi:hypothetical protein
MKNVHVGRGIRANHAHDMQLIRKATRDGITIMGVDYRSPFLNELRVHASAAPGKVSVKETDISVVTFIDPRDGRVHLATADASGLVGGRSQNGWTHFFSSRPRWAKGRRRIPSPRPFGFPSSAGSTARSVALLSART